MNFLQRTSNKLVSLYKSTWLSQEGRKGTGRSSVFNDYVKYDIDTDVDDQLSKSDIRDYLELYQTLHWMFLCVKTIADTCAMLPSRIVNLETNEDCDYYHPISKLFKNPNNLMTRFDLFTKTISYYCLVGNSYWVAERNLDDIVKLHVPRPDRIEGNFKSDGTVDWKRQRNDKAPETWGMRDVIHFYSFNPISDYQGFGSAQGAQQAAILELYQIMFSKRFFQNAVMPSLIFKIPEFLDDAAYERIIVELKRLHVGVDKFFNVALLEGGVEPIDLKKTTPSDADYRENKELTREEIFSTMGCYHLVSLLNGESASAVQQAYKLFYQITLMPLLRNFEDTINKELMSQFPDSENLEFRFDLRNAPGLREDEMQESQADYRYWMSGIKTTNEIRAARGFGKDLQWGDIPPPTLGTSRSRMSPNEFREGEEEQFEHPERYDRSATISEDEVDDMDVDEVKKAFKYLLRQFNTIT